MRKNICIVLFSAILGLSNISYTSAETNLRLNKDTVLVKCEDYVSIRKESNYNSAVIGKLYNNYSAISLGEEENGYIKVKSNDIEGWVNKNYLVFGDDVKDKILNNLDDFNVQLKVTSPKGMYVSKQDMNEDEFDYTTNLSFLKKGITLYKTPSKSEVRKDKYKYFEYVVGISEEPVCIRSKPNKNSEVYAFLDSRDKCELIEETKGYYKIKYNKRIAYVDKKYTKVLSENLELSNIAKVDYKLNVCYSAKKLKNNFIKVEINDKKYFISKDEKDIYFFYMSDSNAVDVLDETSSQRVDKVLDDGFKVIEKNPISKTKINLFIDNEDTELSVNLKEAENVAVDVNKLIGDKSTGISYKYDFDYSKVSKKRAEVIKYALSFLGNPYVYGGTDLENGIDCSAFCMRVLQHSGIQIGRSTGIQVNEGYGRDIDAKDIKPGDLIYYTHDGQNPYHVVMYLGNGKCVNASCPEYGICISNLKTNVLKIKNYID